MGEATKFMQALETVNEKMTDIMLDAKEIQSNMDETNRLMKELAGEDQEDEEADVHFLSFRICSRSSSSRSSMTRQRKSQLA